MPDAPDHMWPFWRDKLGAEAALREQFPEKLRRDPRLQSALRQLDTTRAAIEYIMAGAPNDRSGTDGPAHERDEADGGAIATRQPSDRSSLTHGIDGRAADGTTTV